MSVFVTRALPGSALDRLREQHPVTVWTGSMPPTPRELAEAASDAQGVLTLLTDRVDSALVEACPSLRAVSNYAVGYENVDIPALTARGIPVGHTPGVLTEATAQLAITLTLDLLRRVSEAARGVRRGQWRTWEPSGYLGAGLSDTTLGLIGYGRIGQAVAGLAQGLGMNVIYTDPTAGGCSLPEVLAGADVVSLHALLTPQTRGLIDADALATMRPGALLVNVARGPIVDTAALVQALRSGHLGGAALDVTDPEPLPSNHDLLEFDNVIVTPHMASATVTTRARMAELAVDNLIEALADRPMPHCANPQVYQRAGDRL